MAMVAIYVDRRVRLADGWTSGVGWRIDGLTDRRADGGLAG